MTPPTRAAAALLTAATLSLSGSCSSGSVSPDPLPVRRPEIASVTAPQLDAAPPDGSDYSVEFTVTWTTGRAPFTVRWDFDTEIDPAPATASDRSSTLELTFAGGPERRTGSGTVTVSDALGQSDSAAFTYVLYGPDQS